MSAFLSPIEPAGQDISPASHVPLPWRSGEPSADTRAKGSMSPQMLHGPLSKHAAPPPQSGILPCTKHSHLAPHSFTRYQPLISGCRVWKTLLSYSHDTSPQQRSAVCRGHSLIHMIPAPHQRSAVCREHPLIHMIPAPHQRSAVCRGHSLIHMIPAPHQRQPCLEDTGLLFTRYQPRISDCHV